MNQWWLLFILIGIGIAWTALWLLVVVSVPRIAPEPAVEQSVAALRRRLVFPIGAALLVGIVLSLYWMPYPGMRARTVGQPELTVEVASLQWAWIMSQDTIPANTPVEFALTSRDVNHDFAIYDPDGRLVTQVQAMPGYTNRLIYNFDKPGTYTVRCLEYCGLGHDVMLATLNIV